MSKAYTSKQLANVQQYLMYKGHACPHIIGDSVHYLDRTAGQQRVVKSATIDTVLEEIRTAKTVPPEHQKDYNVGRNRIGVGYYQVAEIQGRLMHIEDLRIELRGLYE